MPPKEKRIEKRLEEAAEQKRLAEQRHPRLKTAEGTNFTFSLFNVLETPLALVVGALHALPSGSSSTACSGYIISSR